VVRGSREAERRTLEGLEKGKLSILLRGEKLKGSVRAGAHQGREDVGC
jgi:hypothetical protein